MSQALRDEDRIVIPRRKVGESIKARPCLGNHASQLEKVRERSFSRYEKAYRDLSKV
ncbi:MAG: hypothetical protein ACTH3D_09390 [Halomonas sp.]|uniref:hypothetical protein n=1 Tax=Halomonas sp. TaxID=1486246 RepID=UPI003F90F9D1